MLTQINEGKFHVDVFNKILDNRMILLEKIEKLQHISNIVNNQKLKNTNP